jgi:hypothetical protein
MASCWADVLGGCDSKISREHFISENFFSGNAVQVKGLPWCKAEPKIIGIGAATAKILCRTHNSSLSPLDAEGGKFMAAIHEHIRLADIRGKLVHTPLHVVRLKINARLLERWLLKILLNLTFEGRFLIGANGIEVGRPPVDLVKIAFGQSSFEGMAGMYVGGHLGLNLDMGEHLEFSPLLKDDNYVLGGFFKVGGILLYLCLEPNGVAVPFSQIPGVDGDWAATDLKWRFKKIKVNHGRYLSHVIEFCW